MIILLIVAGFIFMGTRKALICSLAIVLALLLNHPAMGETLKGKVESNTVQIPLEKVTPGIWATPGTEMKMMHTYFVPGFQYDRNTGKIVAIHPKSYLSGKLNVGDTIVSIDGKSVHDYKWDYNDMHDRLIAVKQELILWPERSKTVVNQFDCVVAPIQDYENVEVKTAEELSPKVNI